MYYSTENELQTIFSGKASYLAILKEDTIPKDSPITDLFLNEICITNKMYVDEFRESDDWIEIYNASSSPVDLGGMFLSDNSNNLTKSMIPLNEPENTTVSGKSYIVFWADKSTSQGANHLYFSLSASKHQTISLSATISDSLVVIDSVTYDLHEKGETYARFSYDSCGSWTKTKCPTFAAPNRLFGYEVVNNAERTDITSNTELLMHSKRIAVYPNPTSAIAYVSFPWDSANYRIYCNGKSCKNSILTSGQQLDLSSLSAGFYILSLWNSTLENTTI